MKKNLSTRIKRNLSRIKSLCIFITDVYLSLDSEFIVNYIESKNIVIMSDNRTIELHDNATYIEIIVMDLRRRKKRQRQKRNSDRCQNLLLILRG